MGLINFGLALLLMVAGGIIAMKFDMTTPGTSSALAPLVGALFGAAASLLGSSINGWNAGFKASREAKERVAKIKALIAAELVNVAAGLMDAKRYVDARLRTLDAGGSVPEGDDLTRYIPKPMPFTESLGTELLLLGQQDIDVLATLRSNLARTALSMREITEGKQRLNLLSLGRLEASIRYDLDILAQTFDQIAPERQLAIEEQSAEYASSILRRLSVESNRRQRAG